MADYLDNLNEAQRAAVEWLDGPELVIAGAGSGKTRVLTYKIVHLISHAKIEPHRILALTFTNKAAREMRERIETLLGAKTASKLWMGTFHSIFARILRINAEKIGFKSNFTVYDEADAKSLLKAIVKDMNLDEKVYKPNIVKNEISAAKNRLMSPAAYAADRAIAEHNRNCSRSRMPEVYAAYMARCAVAGAMDFDDLLYFTNVLLKDNPDVRSHYQEFFRYVLVDEYQDTNYAQHNIVAQIVERTKALCVVGDDAQSIYSFRGANIRNILTLERSLPGLKTFKLEQNYRSTQTITNAANSLIEKNREQIPKTIFSQNDVGNLVELEKCYSDLDEAYTVVARLRALKRTTGDSFNDFAILYRTNAQSRPLEEQLRKSNLPYRIYGGLSFYQRKEIKDAVAYLRLAVNPDDDEAFRRVVNYPLRGIGDTTLAKLSHAAQGAGTSLMEAIRNASQIPTGLTAAPLKKLAAFAEMIDRFGRYVADGLDAWEVAGRIVRESGLMLLLLSENTPENITRRENLEELLNGVKQFVELGREERGDENLGLENFLAEISLATDQDRSDDSGEAVTLMTVHSAKGLEFKNVFIVGVEDDLFPSAMSKQNVGQIEEERRLLYVAMTRAMNYCMLSYAGSRYRNGQTLSCNPSPFLYDIDPRYLKQQGRNSLGRERSGFPVNPRKTENRRERPADRPQTFQTLERQSTARPMPAQGDFRTHSTAEVKIGMTIEHSSFGRGRIEGVDFERIDPRIVVSFDNAGVRTLLMKFARFKII